MKKIEIYSTPSCKYCNLAKDFFTQHGLTYTEYNVATDLAKRKEMVERTGQMGVPVIVVDGATTVGFDEQTIAKMTGVK